MNLRERIETLRDQYATMLDEIALKQSPNSDAETVLVLVVGELSDALAETEPNNRLAVQRSIAGED